jgi:CHAT domain-containing protein
MVAFSEEEQSIADGYFRDNRFDEGATHFEQVAAKFKKFAANDEEAAIRYVEAINLCCDFLLLAGLHQQALGNLEMLNRDFPAILTKYPNLRGTVYNHIAEEKFYLGHYSECREWGKQAEAAFEEKGNDWNRISKSVAQAKTQLILGKSNWKEGDYFAALTHYFHALLLYRQAIGPLDYRLGRIFQAIGQVYLDLGNFEKADKHLKRGEILLRDQLGEQHLYYGAAQNERGKYWLRVGLATRIRGEKERCLEQAKACFDNASDIFERIFLNRTHRYQGSLKTNLGLWTFASYPRQPELALLLFEEEVEIRRHAFNQEFHPTIARAYNYQSRMLLNLNEPERASRLADEVITALQRTLRGQAADHRLVLLEAYRNKAEALLTQFSEKQALERLHEARENLRRAVELIEELRQMYTSEKSQLELGRMARPIHELTFEVLYLLNLRYEGVSEEKRAEVLNDIFQVLQRSKAAVLRAHLFQRQLFQPDAEWPMESSALDHRGENFLDSMEKRILARLDFNFAPSTYEKLMNFLRQHVEQVRSFLRKVNEQRPLISIEEMQGAIDNDTGLNDDQSAKVISYFIGDRAVYVIVMSRTTFFVKQLCEKVEERERLQNLAIQFMEMLDEMANEPKKTKMNGSTDNFFFRFHLTASKLFKLLIQPLRLGDNTRRLYIIPDKFLAGLPFEALVSSFNIGANGYGDLEYLTKKYVISYHQAMSVLYQLYTKTDQGQVPSKPFQGYLGIAAHIRAHGNPDSGSQDRIEREVKIFEYEKQKRSINCASTILLREKVSKPSALRELPKYDLIHVSAHSVPHRNSDGISGILLKQVWSNETEITTRELLTYNDIARLSLIADLVILSSCQTGMGRMEVGEGVFSITRAFLLAGAKNVMYTLFPVNTYDTYQMATKFYALCFNNKSYAFALAEVKRQFIQNPHFCKPSHWAGMVFMGDQTVGFHPVLTNRA